MRGVSEGNLFAEEYDVGLDGDDFTEADVKKAWPKIKGYLLRDPDNRRALCWEKGLAY